MMKPDLQQSFQGRMQSELFRRVKGLNKDSKRTLLSFLANQQGLLDSTAKHVAEPVIKRDSPCTVDDADTVSDLASSASLETQQPTTNSCDSLSAPPATQPRNMHAGKEAQQHDCSVLSPAPYARAHRSSSLPPQGNGRPNAQYAQQLNCLLAQPWQYASGRQCSTSWTAEWLSLHDAPQPDCLAALPVPHSRPYRSASCMMRSSSQQPRLSTHLEEVPLPALPRRFLYHASSAPLMPPPVPLTSSSSVLSHGSRRSSNSTLKSQLTAKMHNGTTGALPSGSPPASQRLFDAMPSDCYIPCMPPPVRCRPGRAASTHSTASSECPNTGLGMATKSGSSPAWNSNSFTPFAAGTSDLPRRSCSHQSEAVDAAVKQLQQHLEQDRLRIEEQFAQQHNPFAGAATSEAEGRRHSMPAADAGLLRAGSDLPSSQGGSHIYLLDRTMSEGSPEGPGPDQGPRKPSRRSFGGLPRRMMPRASIKAIVRHAFGGVTVVHNEGGGMDVVQDLPVVVMMKNSEPIVTQASFVSERKPQAVSFAFLKCKFCK